jgi:predicted Zn-dependent protease with MMP-like domain
MGSFQDERAVMVQGPPDFFDACIREALALIPEEFQPFLDNVAILVDDWAPDDLLDELEVPFDEDLYGLYSGASLLERDPALPPPPCQVTLYKGPLLEDFPDPEDLRREIAVTVLHEIAHHFGIPESRLEELGWD